MCGRPLAPIRTGAPLYRVLQQLLDEGRLNLEPWGNVVGRYGAMPPSPGLVARRMASYRAVQNLIAAYRPVSRCTAPYSAVQDLIGPYRPLPDCTGLYRRVQALIAAYRTVTRRTGSYRAVRFLILPYRTLSVRTASYRRVQALIAALQSCTPRYGFLFRRTGAYEIVWKNPSADQKRNHALSSVASASS